MSVEIDPAELSFRRPFTVEVSQILKIKNPNTVPVAFKVKTTAPKQYCVRPNSGRIEPGLEVEVTVLLQAMKQEPPPDAKCRDKFLVQSAPITSDKEFASIASILDSSEKALIQERKIRVTWLANPDQGSANPVPAAATPKRQSMVNGTDATPDVSRAYSSPGDEHDVSTTIPPPAVDSDSKEDLTKTETAKSTTSTDTSSSNVPKPPTVVVEKVETLAKEKVTTSADTGGLRQRTTTKSAVIEKPAQTAPQLATTARQGVEGVPVHIVAGLCLLSFLLAYFFF